MQKLFLFILIAFPVLSFTQDAPIIFDRPGISDSPYIVDSNRWIVESGINASNLYSISEVLTPSMMLRKFIGFKTELRATYNYSTQMLGMIMKNQTYNYACLALGFKHKLLKESSWIPETSIDVNTYYPIQRISSISTSKIYNLEACFQFQSNITDYFALNYNVGTIFTNQYTKGIINYSMCVNRLVSKKLELFIEGFGYSSANERAELGYDVGCIYYPNRWSQIDVSVINNYYQTSSYASFVLGYSFSFDRK